MVEIVVVFVVVMFLTGSTTFTFGSRGPVVEKYSVLLLMLMTRMYRSLISVVFLVTLNLKFFFILFLSANVPLFAPKGYFDWKNSRFSRALPVAVIVCLSLVYFHILV